MLGRISQRLLEQQHFLCHHKSFPINPTRRYPVKVKSGCRLLAAVIHTVPLNSVIPRRLFLVDQSPHPSAEHVVNDKFDLSRERQLVLDLSRRIKRIGIILTERKNFRQQIVPGPLHAGTNIAGDFNGEDVAVIVVSVSNTGAIVINDFRPPA